MVCSAGCSRACMRTRRTARREQALGPVGQAVELARLLAEALHDPHAGDGFLDDVGDLAGLLLRVPAGREDRRAQPQRGEQQRRAPRAASRTREQRRQDEHRDERHDEQQDVARRRSAGTAGSPGSARRRMTRGDELAGLQLVVAGEVEALQLVEDRGAQVVLHVERDAAAAIAADVGEARRRARRARSAARATAPAVGRLAVMTSSTITFCTSGRIDWISCPPIATPNAMYACFLCGFM